MAKVLDLCCGGGGAAMGYYRSGYAVTGVDLHPQPKYPFDFIQDDALNYAADHAHEYDLIHVSPPCQAFSAITPDRSKHINLIPAFRRILKASGKPYVIENVPRSPLKNPIMLCGTMFGLLVIRHRLFETNPVLWWPPQPCQHLRKVVKAGRKPDRKKHYAAVFGNFSDIEFGQQAMKIDWLGQKRLAQAIPPAYTQWIATEIQKQL